jgi:hypothetical protein
MREDPAESDLIKTAETALWATIDCHMDGDDVARWDAVDAVTELLAALGRQAERITALTAENRALLDATTPKSSGTEGGVTEAMVEAAAMAWTAQVADDLGLAIAYNPTDEFRARIRAALTAALAEGAETIEQAYKRGWNDREADFMVRMDGILPLADEGEKSAPGGEPVAWRGRSCGPEREWVATCDERMAKSEFMSDVRPLYERPTPPTAGGWKPDRDVIADRVRTAVALAISDGEWLGRRGRDGMLPAAMNEARETARKARFEYIMDAILALPSTLEGGE